MRSDKLTSYIIIIIAAGFGFYHLWLVGQAMLRMILAH